MGPGCWRLGLGANCNQFAQALPKGLLVSPLKVSPPQDFLSILRERVGGTKDPFGQRGHDFRLFDHHGKPEVGIVVFVVVCVENGLQ